jgi:hypothetical protein
LTGTPLYKMSIKNFTEYNLPQNAYATFDATSLKSLIIQRLNESEIFRDQNFEGSNINAFIDVVAYMYHTLLFYLNTTSSESTFTTAELYENMNKLVSNLGYKPLGKQTSVANISLIGTSSLPIGPFTIKRFSFVNVSGINYTTLKDISFEKTISGEQSLSISNSILHQGSVKEHLPYTATGEEFEVVRVVNTRPATNSITEPFIADNTFSVFVKSYDTGTWQQWTESSSLYLESPGSLKYEKRLNENGNFEFKFGNDVIGHKLREGDIVQIYYILSDNATGVISANAINGSKFNIFTSPTFESIVADIYTNETTFVTVNNSSNVLATNLNDSTPITYEETVEEIRTNAPKIFSLQNRLVTSQDYEFFISKNFSGVVKSAKVISNDEYTSTVLKYFYDIGLNRPNDDSRVLFNQVRYANSATFNNVNLYLVPTNTIVAEQIPNYLNPSQKQLILNECSLIKDLTHNITFADPVYKAFNIGLELVGEKPSLSIIDNSRLVIYKNKTNTINTTTLKQTIQEIFKSAFANLSLGSVVSLGEISNSILNTYGVESIATRRIDTGFEVQGISCLVWNPIYAEYDIITTSQNYKLANFQYAYFYEISKLANNILIVNT